LYTEEELHHIRMLYAEKVTNVDKWFGWFMDKVRKLGLEDNTLSWLFLTMGPQWATVNTATVSCASAARGLMKNLPIFPS